MPINNITQTISTIPPAGARGVDVQTIFVTKQEDFQDHLQGTTVTELNTLKNQLNLRIGEINSTATTMNGYANTASAGASTATTKAGEASASASGALTSRNQAETFKNNASASATKASQWADNNYNVEVETGRYSAKHWSVVAETVVGGTVKLTGTQTVAGVKTFTSSPIVPVPTTDFHSVPLRSTNITVNVGPGQTYTTINKALGYLSGFYPMYKRDGVTATINLKFDFAMAEQVLVSGIDLGWITIVGEAAETYITHTALTTAFNSAYPAFGVDKGGTSPVIGQLFRFNVEKVGGDKHGLMAYGAGSSADVLSGKGFRGAGATGIQAVNGSTINASGANCSNAGATGLYAASGSTINAESANCSNAGSNGLYAASGSTINAESANCSNAGSNGIQAIQSSTINATGALIQNQTTGSNRIRVQTGSQIQASSVNTTGGTVGVFSQAVNTLTSNGIIYG